MGIFLIIVGEKKKSLFSHAGTGCGTLVWYGGVKIK
jgi:hypothetical protein